MANPGGHGGPELIVGAVDGFMFRIGYMASSLGALRNVLTMCVLAASRNLNTLQYLVLVLPLVGELPGFYWANLRHRTWDADWLLGFFSPSHVLWSWHYEDRPKRRGVLWAKAVSGLLTLLLSACSPYLNLGQEGLQEHEAASISAFIAGATLALSVLDWRHVPLLWLCAGFVPEVWTLLSARPGNAIQDFIPVFVAGLDLMVSTIPLVSISAALAGTRKGGLLWWPQGCSCRNNSNWAHRFGWWDMVSTGSATCPSPSEPLLPNQFGTCRLNGASGNCGLLEPKPKTEGALLAPGVESAWHAPEAEGALHAPEGVSQFNFILHVFSNNDTGDHCTVVNNATGSYATVPAFHLGSMRSVE
ncbi:unnamed protein product [Ectocarpus fasciculatus]